MSVEADFTSYKDALVVLGAAGVAVPLLHSLRISPILAFLFTGAVLSPHGLGLLAGQLPILSWVTISSPESVGKLAEFGVVFLLFLIGLELSYERLLTMRRLVFGLGGLQVAISSSVLGLGAMQLGYPPLASLVIGAALSLSCTSIGIEILAAQKRLSTTTGRTTFSILLFQDLAAIPILLLLNLLDAQQEGSIALGVLLGLAKGVAVLLAIIVAGRYVLRPLFHQVARTGNQDLFIAATLFVVVGISYLTASNGLSMALGAFVAGLLLAETEFRRAIEAAIDPIKGLLLGVFFFSVGLNIDSTVIFSQPGALAATTVAHLIIQFAIIYLLIRAFGFSNAASIESAALLAPSGEFTFVIFTVALGEGLISSEVANILITSAALSMALIPVLAALARRYARSVSASARDPLLAATPDPGSASKALVIGFGRVGQLIGELLETHGVSYVAVDHDARLVAEMRRAGKPVYFGDVRQLEFLNRCGLGSAKATIITIHTQSAIDQIVQDIRAAYPTLPIIARSKDATHARHLYSLGVSDAVPETIEASLQLSEAALVGLGVPTGLVIASIHQKRDDFRAELQGAAKAAGTATRALPGRKRI